MSSPAALILVMLAWIQVAGASEQDGLPRPDGYPDAPTTAYGKLPNLYNSANQTIDCDWYGWAHMNYTADQGLQCLTYSWRTAVVDKAAAGSKYLFPYEYRFCPYNNQTIEVCFDFLNRTFICTVGCFNLSNTTTAIPPISVIPPAAPPPPGSVVTVPPGPPGTLVPPASSTNTTSNRGSSFQQPSVLMVGCAVAGAVAVIFNPLWGANPR